MRINALDPSFYTPREVRIRLIDFEIINKVTTNIPPNIKNIGPVHWSETWLKLVEKHCSG